MFADDNFLIFFSGYSFIWTVRDAVTPTLDIFAVVVIFFISFSLLARRVNLNRMFGSDVRYDPRKSVHQF